MEIEYKIVGGTPQIYNWSGNLSFLETEEVELPNLSNWSGSVDIFEVTLKNPNGQTDDYSDNNSMRSPFDKVPEYPNTFTLWVGTNNAFETSWEFINDQGVPVFSSGGNLAVNTQFRDTLTFNTGCYTFVMTDTDEDGLDFWANNDGSGMVRFREIGASWLKIFNSDFGTNIVHQFTVGYTQNSTSINLKKEWLIFPNPTNNNIIIEGFSAEKATISVIDNLGKIVLKKETANSGFISERIDLSKLGRGIYFVKIQDKLGSTIKKVEKQ